MHALQPCPLPVSGTAAGRFSLSFSGLKCSPEVRLCACTVMSAISRPNSPLLFPLKAASCFSSCATAKPSPTGCQIRSDLTNGLASKRSVPTPTTTPRHGASLMQVRTGLRTVLGGSGTVISLPILVCPPLRHRSKFDWTGPEHSLPPFQGTDLTDRRSTDLARSEPSIPPPKAESRSPPLSVPRPD